MSAATDVIRPARPSWHSRRMERGRGSKHQRKLADLADTRNVFDDLAVALRDASAALSGLERALFNGTSSDRRY